MGRAPQTPKPSSRYPVAAVAASYAVSPEALLFAIQASRTRKFARLEYLNRSAVEALEQPRFTQTEMGRILGIDPSLFTNVLAASPFAGCTPYPVVCLAYLWQATYHIHSVPLITPDRITFNEIASILDCTTQQFRAIVNRYQLELGPVVTQRPSVGSSKGVSTILLEQYEVVQAWFNNYAPYGWQPVYVLALTTGLNRYRIQNYLDATGAEVRVYRDAANGQWLRHYQMVAISKLLVGVQQAGTWLTVEATSNVLRRSHGWVSRRINHASGEYRLSAGGVLAICYPPREVTRLRSLNLVPPAGNWLTERAIAEWVGRGRKWVQARLNQLIGEQRLNDAGRECLHYPPSEVARLQRLSQRFPPAGDWLTVEAMATILGHDKAWLRARLSTKLAKKRVATTGIVRTHYPPAELVRLQLLNEQLAPPAAGWVTVGGIAKRLGKDKGWAKRHINLQLGQTRSGHNNREDTFYPPSELERLRLMHEEAPAAESWLTAWDIARLVNESHAWAAMRVSNHINPALMQERRTPNGRVLPHYPPSEVDRLKTITQRLSPRRPAS